MKKASLYILIAAVLLLIVAAFMLYKPGKKEFDKKVTFSHKETRPYASSICYTTLSSFFNNCKQQLNRDAPYDWANYDSTKNGGQLFFVLSREFNPSKEELDWLKSFVSSGNYVFICAASWNDVAKEYFNLKIDYTPISSYYEQYQDSVNTTLKEPFYKPESTFFNAGYTYGKYIRELDSTMYSVLGVDNNSKPNFIKGTVKNGAFYFHTDPFLFCNYFIMQRNNAEYYQKAISAIPNNISKIIWDDYYTYKKNDEHKETRSSFRVLFSYPAFLWALLLGIALFVIYFIVNYKRKQRFIPPQSLLTNDSLYFAETIGRLYFEKGDHANLAKKMAAYFLEHIRSKYFIYTSQLNNELVHKLSSKSGYDEELCFQLIQIIVDIQTLENINQEQLNKYYLIFQNFYKHNT